MLQTRSQFLIISFVLLILAGCQLTPKSPEQPVSIEDLSLYSPAQQKEQINRAISLLEQGNNDIASKLIDEVLVFNSDHSTARLLKRQLTTAAGEIFKTKRFAQYRVRAGDSLGKIAKKWLGNSIYFVSLAQLNKISKPSLLQPGNKIKIPLTENSEIIINEKRRSADNLKLLEQYRLDKAFVEGLVKSNSLFIIDAHLKQLSQIHQQILNDYAKNSISLSEREIMLSEVTQVEKKSRDKKLRKQYQAFIDTHRRIFLSDEALLLFEDKSYIDAAEKLVTAKKIKQSEPTQEKIFEMEKVLVNKLHGQAIRFYRKHLLNEALNLWELILQLQSNNQLAKTYTQRTQKLLEKLNQY